MKSCKKYYQQIIHFDELPEDDQIQVKGHVSTCSACSGYFRDIQNLTSALKRFQNEKHIGDEQLVRYGIYLGDPKKPDYDGFRFTGEQVKQIQNHIDSCLKCRQRVAQITREYANIEAYLTEAGVPDKTFGKTLNWLNVLNPVTKWVKSIVTPFKGLVTGPRVRVFPVYGISFAVLFILLWISPFFRGSDYIDNKFLSIEKQEIRFNTRNSSAKILNQGFDAFNRGDYQKSITNLEGFINQYSNDTSSVAYAHKISGIAYLFESKKAIFGRFKKYDPIYLDRGIEHLQQVIKLTENKRLLEDAYWFIGKGFLFKKEIDKAAGSFKSVLQFKGEKYKAAQQILENLEGLKKSGNF